MKDENKVFGDDNDVLHQNAEKVLLDVISIAQNLTENKFKKVSLYTQQSKIAYTLWMFPKTRDSYVALALKFYEIFHPEKIRKGAIPFNSFFSMPKMYDIQRASAKLQNQLKWCPPSEVGLKRRRARQDKKFEQYKSVTQSKHDAEIYAYIDESGKTDDFFILGGVTFQTAKQAENVERKLSEAFEYFKSEFKFKDISFGNIENYKKLILKVLKDFKYIRFYYVVLPNKDLAKESKISKTEKCSVSLMRDIAYHHIQSGKTLKLNIVFDVDGPTLDALQQEQIRASYNQIFTKHYGSLCQVSGTKWKDSKELYSLQLADIFASSLNNIYSKAAAESNSARAKKEFAKWFMTELGFNYKNKCFDSDKVVGRILSS